MPINFELTPTTYVAFKDMRSVQADQIKYVFEGSDGQIRVKLRDHHRPMVVADSLASIRKQFTDICIELLDVRKQHDVDKKGRPAIVNPWAVRHTSDSLRRDGTSTVISFKDREEILAQNPCRDVKKQLFRMLRPRVGIDPHANKPPSSSWIL